MAHGLAGCEPYYLLSVPTQPYLMAHFVAYHYGPTPVRGCGKGCKKGLWKWVAYQLTLPTNRAYKPTP